ncbi:MAG: cytochrome c3 family protein [Archaeoglobaceae archaeon]
MKKNVFYLVLSVMVVSATVAATQALDIGPYSIETSLVDRILGIAKPSAEVQNMNREVNYQGNEYCQECHQAKYDQWSRSRHDLESTQVDCETCHGPERTENIDRSRELCEDCHADIDYRPDVLVKVDSDEHFPNTDCYRCHNPHSPWPPKGVLESE